VPFPAALLWDVDGTLAETELDGHRLAFNRAFAEAGLPWRWDPATYLSLLSVSGGRERLRSFLQQVEGAPPSTARVEALQAAKQRHYGALVAGGGLSLRPGVARLLEAAAAAGIPQVIVTTSGRAAVSALLEQLLPRPQLWFRFWVCGEDVAGKKPDPEAYRLALAQLDCPVEQALAIEDSCNGLQAAVAAGLSTLVTRSASSATEPAAAFSAAAAMVDHLGEPGCPCVLLRGPACPEGHITLSYLQQLLQRP
jgi:HAD superfamily hydrolase (TIGR01509 family)